jgi:hypothetical protein
MNEEVAWGCQTNTGPPFDPSAGSGLRVNRHVMFCSSRVATRGCESQREESETLSAASDLGDHEDGIAMGE